MNNPHFLTRIILVLISTSLFACSKINPTEQQATQSVAGETITASASEVLTSPTPGFPDEPIISLNLALPNESASRSTSLLWTGANQIVVTDRSGVLLVNLPSFDVSAPQADVSPQTVAPSENPLFLTGNPQGAVVAWISDQTVIQAWDAQTASAPKTLITSGSPLTGLAINPSESQIAASSFQGEITLLDPSSGQITHQWVAPSWLSNLSFSPDGARLGGADLANFSVFIYSLDGQLKQRLDWDQSTSPALYGAFFSPDWKKIAWVAGSVVQVMEIATTELTPIFGHQDAISAFAWSPDSRFFTTSAVSAAGTENLSQIYLWDLGLPGLVKSVEMQSAVQSLSFSPDGEQLGVLIVSGQLQIIDILP